MNAPTAARPVILTVVGDRWLLLILNEALSGVTRFGDFTKRLNIADNVLKIRLERMVCAGLLRRVRYSGGNHPRYCYLPTSSGSKARKVLEAFAEWGQSK